MIRHWLITAWRALKADPVFGVISIHNMPILDAVAEQGRIRFGFDSAYEELQARDYDRFSSRQTNLRQPRPNTLLRLEF